MREDICTIPIHDVFLPKTGCPICTMRDMLEERMSVYITGAAMMEPDVRTETNRLGFCREHFNQILSKGSRLSVALILESLLAEVHAETFPEGKVSVKKILTSIRARACSCFVCENIEQNMKRMIRNMIQMWQNDPDFRSLYQAQPYLCYSHYGMILDAAQNMPKKNFLPFSAETARLSRKHLEQLQHDVTHFCRMYDYRNKDADWGNSKDAIERTIHYLISRDAENRQKADEKNR